TVSPPACAVTSATGSVSPRPLSRSTRAGPRPRSNPEDTMPRKPAPRDVVTPDELMTAYAVADVLGLAAGTLANWRTLGLGPAYVKLGRRVRYRVSNINDWVSSQANESAVSRPPPGAPGPAALSSQPRSPHAQSRRHTDATAHPRHARGRPECRRPPRQQPLRRDATLLRLRHAHLHGLVPGVGLPEHPY